MSADSEENDEISEGVLLLKRMIFLKAYFDRISGKKSLIPHVDIGPLLKCPVDIGGHF